MKKFITILLILVFSFPYYSAFAMEFNNGYIISDSDLTSYTTMSATDIQSFLDKKAGILKSYTTKDKDNITRSASEIIYNASHDYKINPKFLLTMLQKEQSLIEDNSPTEKQLDWAMGYGVCDNCSMDDPKIQKFKGFGKQVDEAAAAQRWYIDNADNGWLKKAGITYTIDGQPVYIANQATANLYNFTPHIHGNYNFWKIWHSWFTQTYPDGTLLRVEGEDGVWLIKNNLRKPFLSKGALLSRYDPNLIIDVNKSELEKYEQGSAIKFSNYSLLQSDDNKKYLLVDDQLREFESEEVVRTIGYHPEEFEQISQEDINLYEQGELITLSSSYPAGALLQDNKTGGVFFVQDGKKYPVVSRDMLKINYTKYNITPVAPDELEKYERQSPALPNDGLLLKVHDDARVYVISQGKKWPIISGDVFEEIGYKWENVISVDKQTLKHVPLGNFIELDYKSGELQTANLE